MFHVSLRIVANISHPVSFLNSSLGLTGGKNYQKIAIHVFKLDPQKVAFLIFFFIAIFPPHLLLIDVFIAVCGSISVKKPVN